MATQWLSGFERVRDTTIAKIIKKFSREPESAETTLQMLGYMVILNYSPEELEQSINRLKTKDGELAEYLKNRNIDLEAIRDDMGHKFTLDH